MREARETSYWLMRIRDNDLLKPERIGNLIEESNEIVAILTSIVKNSRMRKPVSP
ncbi:MAG: four helix bundle protein [Planctomycetes bacterium]|nr:four helix bundle protein [Planctomycetota bacterium]